MDNKVKLFAVTSIVAVMASGCSGYRNNSGTDGNGGYSSGSGSQVARTGQVRGGGLFGQRRAATCSPCGTTAKPKSTYTYKPAAPKPYTPAPVAGQHNQQYYIDKWNREQAATKNKGGGNYAGYGSGNYNANADAGNTTYYDYSSAGKTTNANANTNTTGSVSASNKSIYTGSYQQKTYKPYQPTTYAGGSSATTNTNTTYAGGGGSTGGSSTYTVKKGDTVFEIMRQTGVYWKDIISLNNLQAPAYNINPGQTIRLK